MLFYVISFVCSSSPLTTLEMLTTWQIRLSQSPMRLYCFLLYFFSKSLPGNHYDGKQTGIMEAQIQILASLFRSFIDSGKIPQQPQPSCAHQWNEKWVRELRKVHSGHHHTLLLSPENELTSLGAQLYLFSMRFFPYFLFETLQG